MGIPSLNSAILYCVSLYFPFTDPSPALRMTPKSRKHNKYLIENNLYEKSISKEMLKFYTLLCDEDYFPDTARPDMSKSPLPVCEILPIDLAVPLRLTSPLPEI